ncbi:phage tail tube protein [Pseudoxanthomonas winnipegensis]|uniref:phage tail tube protein n=1 Tax=Pseudoxanthomonas winnipegensis TaxID=2480810 RepID=UPI001040A137|nr:phage tail tube protein [Pseudoxanthomonas winnipegensis]TBV76879.1 hypothetical protein EYC45_01555 [Pseudoxanthomonas winnipegensis]
MANPLKRLGKATIKVNDTQTDSMPGATIDLGGVARTTQVGANQVLGFTEAPKQTVVELTVSIKRGFDPLSLHVDDANIVFSCDTGQVYTVAHAWSTAAPVIDSGAGTAKYTFEGQAAVQVIG